MTKVTFLTFFREEITLKVPEKTHNTIVQTSVPQKPAASPFAFLNDDTTFMGSLYKHIIEPKLKDLGYNLVVGAAEQLFYHSLGSARGKKSPYSNGLTYDKTAYYAMHGNGSSLQIGGSSLYGTADPNRAKTNNRIWVCESYAETDAKFDEMAKYIEHGGKLSVADMYDLFEVGNAPSTANNIGWTSLSDVRRYPHPEKSGMWVIDMPKPKDIKLI